MYDCAQQILMIEHAANGKLEAKKHSSPISGLGFVVMADPRLVTGNDFACLCEAKVA